MNIVYFLYVASLLFASFTVYEANKRFGFFFNHYFFYNTSWLGLIFLSLFSNDYLKPISPDVYLIFLIGLFVFNFTLFFYFPKKRKLEQVVLDIKVRRLFEVVVIIGLFPAAYVNYTLIRSGIELWKLNLEYWNEARTAGSYLYQQYQQLFLAPMSVLIIGTSFYRTYNYKRKKINLSSYISFFVACFIAVLYLLLSGGGRAEMMLLFYTIILSFCSLQNRQLKNHIFVPNKYVFLFIVLLIVFVLQLVNIGRGYSGDFIRTAISGQIIFVPLFEHYLKNSAVFESYTLGCSMFEPFVVILQYPFKLLGFEFYEIRNNDIEQSFVYLPSLGRTVNAAVSTYFNYMRDFGYCGIIIGPILTASIFNCFYNFCNKNSFYLLFYSCVVMKLCLNPAYGFDRPFLFTVLYLLIFVKVATVKRI